MLYPELSLPKFEPGHVWLTGAGPGDPGLLTLHALNAISQADVIIYDALVSSDILRLAGGPERLLYAGKRGGRPSAEQRNITLQIVELAQQGKRVLRLKGGDPFVFGRGGEEALQLAAEGIPFRIIPGITAGLAGLAYSGIPATHRSVNTIVSFITGHNKDGELDHVDWQVLSDASPVLVFYMALKKIALICEQLQAAGRPANQAVAVISHATTPQQRVLVSDLAHAADEVQRQGIEAPVIIAVGDVVDLHSQLNWFQPEVGGSVSGEPESSLFTRPTAI